MIDQGARLVDIALEDGSAFELDGWKYISESFSDKTVHFIGLLSDGGVHSRIDQLLGFMKGAAKDGAKRIRVHILTVSPTAHVKRTPSQLKPSQVPANATSAGVHVMSLQCYGAALGTVWSGRRKTCGSTA